MLRCEEAKQDCRIAGLQDVNCCRMTKGRLRGDRDSDASERTNRATENRT